MVPARGRSSGMVHAEQFGVDEDAIAVKVWHWARRHAWEPDPGVDRRAK